MQREETEQEEERGEKEKVSARVCWVFPRKCAHPALSPAPQTKSRSFDSPGTSGLSSSAHHPDQASLQRDEDQLPVDFVSLCLQIFFCTYHFRTLDRKTFCLDVNEEVTVADVKTELEDRLGKEDLFRLIYCGRLLKDDDPVRKYEIEEKRWVVVMITRGKTEDISTSVRKEESLGEETGCLGRSEKVDEKREEVGTGLSNPDEVLSREAGKEEEEEDEEIPDIDVSSYLPQDAHTETEKEEPRGIAGEAENRDYLAAETRREPVENKSENEQLREEAEEAEKMEALNLRLQQLRESLERQQREAEEDEEDEESEEGESSGNHELFSSQSVPERLRPGSGGYVTAREFTIALEVIMGMEYYNLHSTSEQVFSDLTTTRAFVEKFFRDTSDLPEVRAMVVDRLDEVVDARPSGRQLEAFLSDLCSIFCQEREEERPRACLELQQEYEEETEDEEEEEEENTAFAANLANLVGMGFIREEAEFALRASFNHPCMAVDYLVSGVPPSAFPPEEENPLAFLRGEPEFQRIRSLVQANPNSLQALLLSFGQQHPALLDTIHRHKATFVRMLHEPTGARGLADDQGLVADSWGRDRR